MLFKVEARHSSLSKKDVHTSYAGEQISWNSQQSTLLKRKNGSKQREEAGSLPPVVAVILFATATSFFSYLFLPSKDHMPVGMDKKVTGNQETHASYSPVSPERKADEVKAKRNYCTGVYLAAIDMSMAHQYGLLKEPTAYHRNGKGQVFNNTLNELHRQVRYQRVYSNNDAKRAAYTGFASGAMQACMKT